jgi:hypothetical protein
MGSGAASRCDPRGGVVPVLGNQLTPYYADEFVTLYWGDAREVVPRLPEAFEAVITDPVWPDAPESIPGHHEHEALIRAISTALVGRAKRLVVHLGSTSDPRWLMNVDARWPFLMSQQLEYAMPSFRGRSMLNDVAYAFGEYPTRKECPGKVHPGRITCTSPRDVKSHEHPAARSLEHVSGLVKWWAHSGPVLDPFAGSGTTLLACKRAGVTVVGVEREARFCELIVSRLRQTRMQFEKESA